MPFNIWSNEEQQYVKMTDNDRDIFDIAESRYRELERGGRYETGEAWMNRHKPDLVPVQDEDTAHRQRGYKLTPGLNSRHKSILINRIVDDWTFAQIGAEYGINTSRAAKVFYDAKGRLYADLEEYEDWATSVGIRIDLAEVEGW